MNRRLSRTVLALLTATALMAAACGGDGDDGETTSSDNSPERGGILRVEIADFGFTGAFDPTAEYLGQAWSYYTNMLVRTLVTYRHIAGPPGNELVPDLAESVPEVGEDGLTYTFRLKDGIRFGPPVDREITSQDIVYAFERIADPTNAAQYAFYYTPIEGWQEFADGDADSISGIRAPDEKTIEFTLSDPVGDFLYRLAMPATGPVPEEVAKCARRAGDYGRYVISSGPYMLEGSDQLDASTCAALEPISGYDPNRRLSFVRNPNYDPATDSPDVRENFIDGMEININTNIQDQYNKIAAGELDISLDEPPAQVLREYSTNQELEDRMAVPDGDRIWYITLNMTQPPFDDIHVRKAVNLVMDKEALQRAWGGPIQGEIATHILPPVMTGGHPTADEYDPYPSDNFAGDVEAAKEEMAQSRYEADGDGICDAEECSGVLHINRNVPPWTEIEPVVESSLEEIGINLQSRELDPSTAYTTIQTTARNIPIASNPGWGKDYADASTFMVLFDSRSLIPQGNVNYSLVGLTPDMAGDLGVSGSIEALPTVDAEIDECSVLVDQERTGCWIALDQKLMEEVVPMIPFLWSNNVQIFGGAVTKFEYDQFPAEPAWSHIAVDPSAQ